MYYSEQDFFFLSQFISIGTLLSPALKYGSYQSPLWSLHFLQKRLQWNSYSYWNSHGLARVIKVLQILPRNVGSVPTYTTFLYSSSFLSQEKSNSEVVSLSLRSISVFQGGNILENPLALLFQNSPFFLFLTFISNLVYNVQIASFKCNNIASPFNIGRLHITLRKTKGRKQSLLHCSHESNGNNPHR